MGVLTGIAIDKRIINSGNDPISLNLNSELHNHFNKDDITIFDLLTMRVGISIDETKVIIHLQPLVGK